MQMAKENVSKFYPVVGVLEMFNETLKVLEHVLPKYFKGSSLIAQKAYHDAYKAEKEQNYNHKKPVSEEIKDLVKRNMTYEIEFYDFCKKRLQQQLKSIIWK